MNTSAKRSTTTTDPDTLQQIAASMYKQNAELVKLDKLKDEFVSIASHELRTPLTIIKNYVWMALHKASAPLPPDVTEDLTVALKATDRLMVLVEDMLTASRIEGGRMQLQKSEYNLSMMISETVKEYGVKAREKNITLTLSDDSANKLMVTGDKNKIHEVIINLIDNALKFTPQGGAIIVKSWEAKGTAYIAVSDTGPGISPENQKVLFTKFGKIDDSYRNLPATHGTGLGLYISRQIVRLHGGDIQIQSQSQSGSTFIVHFPVYSDNEGGALTQS